MKICKQCGRNLNLGDFYKNHNYADGCEKICKTCRKQKRLSARLPISVIRDHLLYAQGLKTNPENAGEVLNACHREKLALEKSITGLKAQVKIVEYKINWLREFNTTLKKLDICPDCGQPESDCDCL